MLVAEQDGFVHIVETIWRPGTPGRREKGIRAACGYCAALILDKKDTEFFEGVATCLRCHASVGRR